MNINDNIQLGEYNLTIKELKELLYKYLIKHSDRKLTNLYLNINNRSKYFVFVNLKNDKLVKINNSDLVVRILHIKNKKELQIIFDFLNKYILNSIITPDFNSLIMIRIDLLLAYLNKIKYDLDKLDVKMNNYFSFSYIDVNKKRIVIGNIERDYLLSYKFYKIFNEYLISENKILVDSKLHNYICEDAEELINNKNELNLIEIDQEIINTDKYKSNSNYLVDGLDIVSLKWLSSLNQKDYSIYLIYKQIDKVFKFISFISTSDMNIITLRPFVSFAYKQKGKR